MGVEYRFCNERFAKTRIVKKMERIVLKQKNPGWDWLVYDPIWKPEVDLIHTFNSVCALKGIPWVVTFESTVPRTNQTVGKPWEKNGKPFIPDKFTSRSLHLLMDSSCKACIALSDSARRIQDNLLNQISGDPTFARIIQEKTAVIHPPQDVLIDAWEIKKKFHTISSCVEFIFVGRNFFCKGGYLLIEALEKFSEKVNFHLTVVSNLEKVKWGGYGTIDASMVLLRNAVKRRYDYYHLMSGADFPLKTNKEINDFLEKHLYDNHSKTRMTNYLTYGVVRDEIVRARVSHYNVFVPFFRIKPWYIGILLKKVNALGYHIQKAIHVDCLKGTGLNLYKGSLWYTISHECAWFFLKNEKVGKRLFGKMTFSGDEYVLQTLFMNSAFRNTGFISGNGNMSQNLYEIDWEHTKGDGSPHLFTIEDVAKLDSSENLFACKFDENVDSKVIDYLFRKLTRHMEEENDK